MLASGSSGKPCDRFAQALRQGSRIRHVFRAVPPGPPPALWRRTAHCPVWHSKRAISSSAFLQSFSSRARSLAKSMTSPSGSATVASPSTNWAEPLGTRRRGVCACQPRQRQDDVHDDAASAGVGNGDAPPSAPAGFWPPAGTFISARTERTPLIRSITQCISAAASASARQPCHVGPGASISMVCARRRGARPTTLR